MISELMFAFAAEIAFDLNTVAIEVHRAFSIAPFILNEESVVISIRFKEVDRSGSKEGVGDEYIGSFFADAVESFNIVGPSFAMSLKGGKLFKDTFTFVEDDNVKFAIADAAKAFNGANEMIGLIEVFLSETFVILKVDTLMLVKVRLDAIAEKYAANDEKHRLISLRFEPVTENGRFAGAHGRFENDILKLSMMRERGEVSRVNDVIFPIDSIVIIKELVSMVNFGNLRRERFRV